MTLGSLGALPLLGISCSAPGNVPADLKFLSTGEYTLFQAIVDAFIPSGGAFALGAKDVKLAQLMDQELAKLEPALVQGLKGGLFFLEYLAGPLNGCWGRMSRLSDEDRVAVLAALSHSRFALLRELVVSLKVLSTLTFYDRPEVWPQIAYDGPWVKS